MKTQILKDFLGNLTMVNYIVAFIFIFLALIFKWTVKTRRAIKNNPNTPAKFNWNYWYIHNFKPKLLSFIAGTLGAFFVLRFATELFGVVFSYAFALVLGLTLDWWINRLKKIKPQFFNKKK